MDPVAGEGSLRFDRANQLAEDAGGAAASALIAGGLAGVGFPLALGVSIGVLSVTGGLAVGIGIGAGVFALVAIRYLAMMIDKSVQAAKERELTGKTRAETPLDLLEKCLEGTTVDQKVGVLTNRIAAWEALGKGRGIRWAQKTPFLRALFTGEDVREKDPLSALENLRNVLGENVLASLFLAREEEGGISFLRQKLGNTLIQTFFFQALLPHLTSSEPLFQSPLSEEEHQTIAAILNENTIDIREIKGHVLAKVFSYKEISVDKVGEILGDSKVLATRCVDIFRWMDAKKSAQVFSTKKIPFQKRVEIFNKISPDVGAKILREGVILPEDRVKIFQNLSRAKQPQLLRALSARSVRACAQILAEANVATIASALAKMPSYVVGNLFARRDVQKDRIAEILNHKEVSVQMCVEVLCDEGADAKGSGEILMQMDEEKQNRILEVLRQISFGASYAFQASNIVRAVEKSMQKNGGLDI